MYLQIHALSQKKLSKETHFVTQCPGLIKLLTAAAKSNFSLPKSNLQYKF